MTIDIFTHNNFYFSRVKAKPERPSFAETVSASLGYQYRPVMDYLERKFTLDQRVDPKFNPVDYMEGYEQYPELMLAPNKAVFDSQKDSLDANLKRREVLYNSSFLANLGAGLFDPINIVALPFGGPAIGVGRSALRTGLSIGTLQAGQEMLRQPFDIAASPIEPVLNVGTATLLGAGLGSLISIPSTRKATAFLRTKEALGEMELSYKPIINRYRPDPSTGRPLSQIDDISLQNQIDIIPSALKGLDDLEKSLRDELNSIPNAPEFSKQRSTIQRQLEGIDKARTERTKELELHKSEKKFRLNESAAKDISKPYNISKSAWTDSWFYKFVTTPMKRQLQDDQITDVAKKIILDIAGDNGITLNLHRFGLSLAPSVHLKAQMRHGEWVQVHDGLVKLYQKEYKLGKEMFPDLKFRSKAQKVQNRFSTDKIVTFEDWITSVNKKRVKGEKAIGEAETEAMALLDNYYKMWSERLEQSGLLGSERSLTARVEYYNKEITKVSQQIDDLLKNKGSQFTIENKNARLARLQAKLDEVQNELAFVKDSQFMPKFEEVFNPRYWDNKAIQARRNEFADILRQWYKENPEIIKFNPKTEKYETIRLSDNPKAIDARVNETIDTILGLKDPTNERFIYYGMGKSKHLKHRELDIPNSLVSDFIQLNPVSVMRTYSNRIAPIYEFQTKFNRNIDDLLDEVDDQMADAGVSFEKRNAYLRDARHLYDRVAGKVLREPDSWDQNVATILKDLAALNYLGSAGFATLPDLAKIMMEHEAGTVFKSLFGVMSDSKVRLSAQEGRIAGEILEILIGDAHMRHTEYLQNNVFNEGFVSQVRSTFYIANLLAPATNIFKKFDAIARGHTLIDYSKKLVAGEATDFEITYLARYGIDSKIAKEITEAPFETTVNGLYLPNSMAWEKAGVKQSTIETYRTAMNSGIMNTILMGTPADKPIAVDGVFYIPIHIAKRFGMQEDPKFRGYARVENGLLGLPFQFMSYSFAAANKVTAALAQGQVKNRAAVITAAMGLGYMSMELKYSDWQMKKMTMADKIARSFDASGIAALYSDLFYTAMNTSLALGGPDIGMGIINPKFPQEQNYLDAFTGVAGASPSYAVDVGRGLKDFIMGDFGGGAADILRSLPGAKLWFLKDEINALGKALESTTEDKPSRMVIGRY